MCSADTCVFRDPYMGKRPAFFSSVRWGGFVSISHSFLVLITKLPSRGCPKNVIGKPVLTKLLVFVSAVGGGGGGGGGRHKRGWGEGC